jgi:hypothetical protein
MCIAPRITMPAAPPPPPTSMDRGVLAARDAQRRRQRQAGGFNSTLLTGAITPATSQGKTLLGA